jgi:hypothetical protein
MAASNAKSLRGFAAIAYYTLYPGGTNNRNEDEKYGF